MVARIARTELRMMLRDGRFRASAALVTLLLAAASITGWLDEQLACGLGPNARADMAALFKARREPQFGHADRQTRRPFLTPEGVTGPALKAFYRRWLEAGDSSLWPLDSALMREMFGRGDLADVEAATGTTEDVDEVHGDDAIVGRGEAMARHERALRLRSGHSTRPLMTELAVSEPFDSPPRADAQGESNGPSTRLGKFRTGQ